MIVHGKPSFFLGRGTLSLRVDDIRAVGIGELLARHRAAAQAAGGRGPVRPGAQAAAAVPARLHRPGHRTGLGRRARRACPTRPRAGRRCGSGSRTPPAQGALAVPQIVDAIGTLDRDPQVDVIVLARGGGSIEDLLPFSDETLCRAVADCRTPVVSAIGHEPDTPLVDHVADLRCSTPTEAGRRLVPDLAEETARIAGLRDRARRALAGWVRPGAAAAALAARTAGAGRPAAGPGPAPGRDRPAPAGGSRRPPARAGPARHRHRSTSRHRLAALGPAATLARGYAIVQRVSDGPGPPPVLRSVGEVAAGDRLRIRVGDGALAASVRREAEVSEEMSELRANSARAARRSSSWATSRPATSSPRWCAPGVRRAEPGRVGGPVGARRGAGQALRAAAGRGPRTGATGARPAREVPDQGARAGSSSPATAAPANVRASSSVPLPVISIRTDPPPGVGTSAVQIGSSPPRA